MLQSAPGVLFTLVAGPLTDSWGRRPSSSPPSSATSCSTSSSSSMQSGFLNSKYFCITHHILVTHYDIPDQAEYLLLECLQDLTGGSICFYLAIYSYMSDITSSEARSRRLSWLDSFTAIGSCIGLPLGSVN